MSESVENIFYPHPREGLSAYAEKMHTEMVSLLMQVNPTPPSNIMAMLTNALNAAEASKLINSTEKSYFNALKTIISNFTTWSSLKTSLLAERATVVADDDVESPYVQMAIDAMLSDCDFVINHSLESTFTTDVVGADCAGALTGLSVGVKYGKTWQTALIGVAVGCALYSGAAALDNYLDI